MNLCNIGQIKALLSEAGFHFSKAMGQNFLTAAWVPQRIAEEAELDGQTGVLEVGPGIGCLTLELSRLAGKVVTVELDKSLAPILEKTLAGHDNIELIFGDVLRENLPGLVREKLPGLKPVVCANLPYHITSPLIAAFLEAGCFARLTLMVQREVARRLCARAGSADYGAFTVFVNWHAEPKILFDVSPGCFMPQPKVWSSVIQLETRSAPPAKVKDEALFFRLVRAAFNQRRKTLVNALSAGLPYSKAQLTEVVSACGFDPRIRGEMLDIPAFAALADKLYSLQADDEAGREK